MKLKGIKSAVRHFNWAEHATVMWDSGNDEVWTDVFGGCSDWNVYHDDKIKAVLGKNSLWESTRKTTMKEIRMACEKKSKEMLEGKKSGDSSKHKS